MANPKGVDQSFRRTFDPEEYKERRDAQLAKKVADIDDQPVSKFQQRAPLKSRDFDVKLDEKLGQKVIFKDGPAGMKGGYYCETCDCVINDSSNYLDHINGRKHQKALGRSMRVERSTVSQVRQRLESYKQQEGTKRAEPEFDYDTYMQAQQLEQDRQLQEKRDKKREAKQEHKRLREERERKEREEYESQLDPALLEMGFPLSFGGSKK